MKITGEHESDNTTTSFDDIVSGLDLTGDAQSNIDRPHQCRDCPWMSDLEASTNGALAARRGMFDLLSDFARESLIREDLHATATELAERMQGKPQSETVQIGIVEVRVLPDATAESIIQSYLSALNQTISEGDATIESIQKVIADVADRCGGAAVWEFVEDPDRGDGQVGAIATMACNAPEGAFELDAEDGNTRTIGPPRRFSPESWAPYREQIDAQRRGRPS
jgi:hypothetical protein